MNSKFKDIFISYDDFKLLVIDKINWLEQNPIYMTDENKHYNDEKIFYALNSLYGDFRHNYNTDELFIYNVVMNYNLNISNLYNEMKAFKEIELDKISNDYFLSVETNERETFGNRKDLNESKQGVTPTDVNFNQILDDLGISGAARNDALSNYRNNSVSSAKLVNDYRLFRHRFNAKFNTSLNDFVNTFGFMFMTIGKDVYTEYDVETPVDSDTFKNGYKVNEVDYLGLENRLEIIAVNNKTNVNTNNISGIYNDINEINADIRMNTPLEGNNITLEQTANGTIINASGGEGKTYIGENPISVDNDNNIISLDMSVIEPLRYNFDARELSIITDYYVKTPTFNELSGVVESIQDELNLVVPQVQTNVTNILHNKPLAGTNISLEKTPNGTVISATGGEGITYQGIDPIIVDNVEHTIGFDSLGWAKLANDNIWTGNQEFQGANNTFTNGISINNMNYRITVDDNDTFNFKKSTRPSPINVANPTLNTHATNKLYVDTKVKETVPVNGEVATNTWIGDKQVYRFYMEGAVNAFDANYTIVTGVTSILGGGMQRLRNDSRWFTFALNDVLVDAGLGVAHQTFLSGSTVTLFFKSTTRFNTRNFKIWLEYLK